MLYTIILYFNLCHFNLNHYKKQSAQVEITYLNQNSSPVINMLVFVKPRQWIYIVSQYTIKCVNVCGYIYICVVGHSYMWNFNM